MAKKTTTHNYDRKTGKVTIVTSGKATRAQRKSTESLIPWTPAPKTRGQKIRRALWG